MYAIVMCHHICHADEYPDNHSILMIFKRDGDAFRFLLRKNDFIYYLLYPITPHGISRPGKDHKDQTNP